MSMHCTHLTYRYNFVLTHVQECYASLSWALPIVQTSVSAKTGLQISKMWGFASVDRKLMCLLVYMPCHSEPSMGSQYRCQFVWYDVTPSVRTGSCISPLICGSWVIVWLQDEVPVYERQRAFWNLIPCSNKKGKHLQLIWNPTLGNFCFIFHQYQMSAFTVFIWWKSDLNVIFLSLRDLGVLV